MQPGREHFELVNRRGAAVEEKENRVGLGGRRGAGREGEMAVRENVGHRRDCRMAGGRSGAIADGLVERDRAGLRQAVFQQVLDDFVAPRSGQTEHEINRGHGQQLSAKARRAQGGMRGAGARIAHRFGRAGSAG